MRIIRYRRMIDIFGVSSEMFNAFFLILMRVSVILFMFPVFNNPMFPNLVKAGLAFFLAIILFPVVQVDIRLFPESTVELMLLLVSELMIGLILGFAVRLLFAGVRMAGQLIGFQMGFMMANVIDPMSGTSVSIIEQLGSWTALLVFLVFNGHHMVIFALIESFQLVQIGFITLKSELFAQILSLSSDMFVLTIKIGSPAIAALLFTDISFGLIAKFVPQMNILIVGFPVKIAVGLTFIGVSLQIIAIHMRSYLAEFPFLLRALLSWMGDG